MKKSLIFSVNCYFIFLIISENFNVGECLRNGNTTVGNSFKYQVFLTNGFFRYCSGVIIDEWHILTAAHCVYRNTPSDISVYAGTNVLRRGYTEIYDVQKIRIHQDYEISRNSISDMNAKPWPYHRANDIAVLTLETPLLLGNHIQNIPLPVQEIAPFTSSKCLMSGWDLGELDKPGDVFVHQSWVEVIVTSPEYCRVLLNHSIRKNELCVSERFGRIRIHYPDTGGGLLCDGVLVGIIQTSNRDMNYPTVHANVYHFLDFINQVKAEDQGLYCTLF